MISQAWTCNLMDFSFFFLNFISFEIIENLIVRRSFGFSSESILRCGQRRFKAMWKSLNDGENRINIRTVRNVFFYSIVIFTVFFSSNHLNIWFSRLFFFSNSKIFFRYLSLMEFCPKQLISVISPARFWIFSMFASLKVFQARSIHSVQWIQCK